MSAFICAECGLEVTADELFNPVNEDGKPVCVDCKSKQKCCDDCKEPFTSLYDGYFIYPDLRLVCRSCSGELYGESTTYCRCFGCEKHFRIEEYRLERGDDEDADCDEPCCHNCRAEEKYGIDGTAEYCEKDCDGKREGRCELCSNKQNPSSIA